MIGGEFEIDLSNYKDSHINRPHAYYYASGRAALYQILRSISKNGTKVWLPDWLCSSVVDAVRRAGYQYAHYNLDDNYQVDVQLLEKVGVADGDLVIIINYFGLLNTAVCSKKVKGKYPHAIIIEDDVQAYWFFEEQENEYADFRFTSLRKALPIPDGGIVRSKYRMPIVIGENTFAPLKFKAGTMKLNRGAGIKDEDYLRLFEEGERLIDDNYDSRMSTVSQSLYDVVNVKEAKIRRKNNAAYLIKGLEAINIHPIIEVSDSVTPLFIPIYLNNRNGVRKQMFQHEIFCPVHWPLEGMKLKLGAEMAEHELSLIIDQRYTEDDMDQILEIIKNAES